MSRYFLAFMISLCISLSTFAQQYGSFKDSRDGKVYKTVKIGNQEWMAENLNIDRFRNGDIIPEAKSKSEWIRAAEEGRPAWCYYNNDPSIGVIHGKLYNWFAVKDSRGLAPLSWSVANTEDWDGLSDFFNLDGSKLKVTNGWPNTPDGKNGNGSNSSGFSARPSGIRDDEGEFYDLNETSNWWTSEDRWERSLSSYNNLYYSDFGREEGFGLSVRCIRKLNVNQNKSDYSRSNEDNNLANNIQCDLFKYSEYRLAKMNLESGQNFDYYFNLAWEFVRLQGEKSYNAIVNFEEAIRLNPSRGGVYSDLGNCYRGGFKCYKKAEEYYTKAIQKGFTKGFVYYNRAICRYNLRNISGMRSDLNYAKENGWPYDPSNLRKK